MLDFIRNEVKAAEAAKKRYDLDDVTFPTVMFSALLLIMTFVLFVSKVLPAFLLMPMVGIYFAGFFLVYVATAFFKVEKPEVTRSLILWSCFWPGFILLIMLLEIFSVLVSVQKKIVNFHKTISSLFNSKPAPIPAVTVKTPVIDNGAYRTQAACGECERPL